MLARLLWTRRSLSIPPRFINVCPDGFLQTKVPHGASITLALLVGLSVVVALILVISHSVKDLTRNAKQYERRVFPFPQTIHVAATFG